MDLGTMVRQFVDLSKASFDNGYEALTIIQDQTGKIANAFMDQAVWVPSEGRDSMGEFVAAFKKNREDFKNTLDEEFEYLGGYLDSALGKGQE